jgi:molybdopterin molybdotransferase
MTTVKAAEEIILAQAIDYGAEHVPLEQAMGRVLAEDLKADRDLPPCDRVTMDGIAIKYSSTEAGIKSFNIIGTIAAGDTPINISANECVEIMTGAALPGTADTIVRYEDVNIKDGIASLLTDDIRKGQNIHYKGKDKKKNDTVAVANEYINPAHISMAASVGKATLAVKKLPKVVIISTGDELVDVDKTPTPYQVRRSNSYAMKAVLQQYSLHADTLHIPDEPTITRTQIEACLTMYDVIILSGGISMGKFDYVPQVLEELKVQKLFHKVQQRPGKPFWFGKHENGVLVFAFPGNPVSTFMCLHRYFLPWLERSLGLTPRPAFAELNEDITFTPALQYFAQVKLKICKHGHVHATPMEGHGSGDFANLLDTDAFMELPMEQSIFKKGDVYRIWPFKNII